MGFYDIDYNSQEDKNIYLLDSKKGFELIAKLVASVQGKEDISNLLLNINKLIDEDFIELCKCSNQPNQLDIYRKLRSIYEDVKDMTDFSALANKNIVALGGGFSAGKSRLINTLLGDDILPIKTTPSTSIPTYIRTGIDEKIYALNTFNVKASIDREGVKAISHDFNREYNISFSHIIKLLMIETQNFKYNNIAILDTPGYSKVDSLQENFNTDKLKAREHLSQADYLIWVIDIQNGTLPDTDIEFIRSLDYDGEIFFVINRADLRTPEEREEVMNNVRDRIKASGFNPCGLLLFSSVEEKKELKGDSIFEYLNNINEKVKSTNIKKRFKKFINQMKNHISSENETLKENLGYFNKFILYNPDISGDISIIKESLKRIKDQVSKNEMTIYRLKLFSDKFNEAIDVIMKKICVIDEVPAQHGIEVCQRIKVNDKIWNMEMGSEFEGSIKQVNSFGVFIEGPYGEEIMISKGRVVEKYTTNYRELFIAGEKCRIQIKDIDHGNKEVIFLIIPNI